MGLDNLKPEQTMLLISLLRTNGIGRTFKGKISEFASVFGTSPNTVTSLFEELKQCGYLQIEESFRLRGKGERTYSFTDEISDLLVSNDFLKWAVTESDPAVESLVLNDLPAVFFQDDTIRKSFRGSNRLFLLIFLWRMDKLGVVEISTAEVCKIMGGIKRDRFKSQLSKLKKLGIFRYIVFGMTGVELLGKTKSRYFVNLSHPLFGIRQNGTSCVKIALSVKFQEVNEETEATLLNAYSKLKKPLPPVLPNPLSQVNFSLISDLFKDDRLHDQLQLRLFEIASELLSSNWDDLKTIKNIHRLQGLCSWDSIMPKHRAQELYTHEDTKFLKDVCHKMLRATFDDKDLDYYRRLSDAAKQYTELLRLFLLLSTAIARRYKSLLLLANDNEFSADKFAIVPISRYRNAVLKFEIRYWREGLRKDIEVIVDDSGAKIRGVGGVFKPLPLQNVARDIGNILQGHKVIRLDFERESQM